MAQFHNTAKKEQRSPQETILATPQAWPPHVVICAGQQDWDGQYVRHCTFSEADAQRQVDDWAAAGITGTYLVIQTPHNARPHVLIEGTK